MRILVTGSGGFVGRHLFAKLQSENHHVIALRRGAAAPLVKNVFIGPDDLADIEKWSWWPEDIDTIVHLAALNPSRGDSRAYDLAALRRANVESTRALAARAANEGVKRVVFVSTANVHCSADGRTIVETAPLAPRTPYAISKMEAERGFWEALAGSRTEGCVLRPAPIYGQGGRGNVAGLVRLARLPIPLPILGISGLRSLVAVDHLVDVLAMCLDGPAAAGEVFLVADEGPLAPAEIVGALRRGWGRAPRLLASPAGPLGRLARAVGKGDSWREITGSFVLDTRHLQERLGWRSSLTAEAKLQRLAAAGAFC